MQDPDTAWRRVAGRGKVRAEGLAALRAAAAWREREARRRDLPAAWLVKDATLVELARRRPATPKEAEGVRGLQIRRGRQLDDLLATLADPGPPPEADAELPGDVRRRIRVVLPLASAVLQARCAAAGVASELVATRADLEAFIAGQALDSDRPHPLLTGLAARARRRVAPAAPARRDLAARPAPGRRTSPSRDPPRHRALPGRVGDVREHVLDPGDPARHRGALGASPAAAGLTITVVVLAVAAGGWVAGPLSDRLGRARVMAAAAAMICVPTALAGLAPNLPVLLAIRACQGLLMPGLLTVAVPYVTERFRGPAAGAAMGAYTASLVFGGLVGRVGTAIVADLTSWRVGLAALTIPTVAGALAMHFWLPRDEPRHVRRDLRAVVAEHVRNVSLLLNAVAAGATFFAFVGDLHIRHLPPHRRAVRPHASPRRASSTRCGWSGAIAPLVGHAAARIGPQRLLPFLLACAGAGAALTLVDNLAAVISGLALLAAAMFSTVTTCQLLIPRLVSHHRGTATSLHQTIYYVLGGVGAYLPGLWLDDGWHAVVAACCVAVAVGAAASLGLAVRRSDTLAGDVR